MLRLESEAHAAAVKVFAELLGSVKDEDIVDAADQPRQVALVALAHMLADAWRVLTSLPRYNADQLRALVEALYGAKP